MKVRADDGSACAPEQDDARRVAPSASPAQETGDLLHPQLP